MSHIFYECTTLTSLDLSNFNNDNVIDMSHMFYNCSALDTLNLSNFKTKKLTNDIFFIIVLLYLY